MGRPGQHHAANKMTIRRTKPFGIHIQSPCPTIVDSVRSGPDGSPSGPFSLLLAELLSRFAEFRFTPYTREEFVEVAVAVIRGQLGKAQDLARYIAERVSHRTRDVRQAIHVAQLCDTREEVDRFESGAEPGRIL